MNAPLIAVTRDDVLPWVTVASIAALVALTAAWWRRDEIRRLPSTYAADVALFRSPWRKVGLLAGLLIFISIPVGFSWIGVGSVHLPNQLVPFLPLSSFWLTVLNYAGLYAIAAIALNLLIGYTGQISLGHAAFIGLGAYATGYFGRDILGGDMPPWLWLILCTVLGGLISGLIGPFALRLRGNYLAIVSLAILEFSRHYFLWDPNGITGATQGRPDLPPVTAGPLVFRVDGGAETDFFGYLFDFNQGYFWLIWGAVILSALLAKNLVRTRQGRAMMAVRDRDLSAEVIGVSLFSTKVKVFALSGAMAAFSGALYGSLLQALTPEQFGLVFSIQFVAMIIIGGVGSVFGSVVGAVLVSSLQFVFDQYKDQIGKLPLIAAPGQRGLTPSGMVLIIYGLFIIVFLIYFPNGVAGLWERVKRYFRTWPFSV